MTIDQFVESVSDLQELSIEKYETTYNNLNYIRIEKSIEIGNQDFENAAIMRDRELNILSEIINKEIVEMFFVTYRNVGYYLVYCK